LCLGPGFSGVTYTVIRRSDEITKALFWHRPHTFIFTSGIRPSKNQPRHVQSFEFTILHASARRNNPLRWRILVRGSSLTSICFVPPYIDDIVLNPGNIPTPYMRVLPACSCWIDILTPNSPKGSSNLSLLVDTALELVLLSLLSPVWIQMQRWCQVEGDPVGRGMLKVGLAGKSDGDVFGEVTG